MKHLIKTILPLFLLMTPISWANASTAAEQWNFSVWLDEKEIGYYRVIRETSNDTEHVTITTKLAWRFLSIPFYNYTHSNTEIWQDQCLTTLNSETDDNGEKNFVRARPSESGLALSSHQGESQLEGCIRSFAYWNPEMLKAKRLLNSQTGEYTPVTISPLNPADFSLELKALPANSSSEKPAWGYRLTVEDKNIDLWYSASSDWLALQTRVKGGRLLSYYRTKENA